MGPWNGTLGRNPHLLAAPALQLPAHARCCHTGGEGRWRRMRGCSPASQREAPAPAPALAQGSAGTLSSCRPCPAGGDKRCVTCSSTRMSPSPSWPEPTALREALTSKPHLPGCSGPPTALPTHNPPGQGGIRVRAGCAAGQSSLPGTAGGSRDSRGARRCRGASPRPAGLRPDTGHSSSHGWAVPKRPGLGGPSGASPPTAKAAFPLPAPSVRTGAAAQTPAGEKRLRKEMEGARRSWQVESRRGRGHLRPAAGRQGAPGGPRAASTARLRSITGTGARGRCPILALPGRETLPPPSRDDTSSPSSSRSTLFLQEPGSPGSGQAARASLLPAPPALPAPALAPASMPGPRRHTPSPACHGDLGALPRPLRAKLPGDAHGTAGGDGSAGTGTFFPICLLVG